jgi:hypothetical protein
MAQRSKKKGHWSLASRSVLLKMDARLIIVLILLQNNLSRAFKGLLWDSSPDPWVGHQAKSRSSWCNYENNWMISLTSYWIMRQSLHSPINGEFVLIVIIDM